MASKKYTLTKFLLLTAHVCLSVAVGACLKSLDEIGFNLFIAFQVNLIALILILKK